ncbi:MAG: heparinase II/III family protein [Acidobacteriota bacterium]|nr:heparinase II/III family protein [Acidobacteriota bacterium]MDP9112876.1 heparinase II/III family protein [Acidobacteriota bacterium]
MRSAAEIQFRLRQEASNLRSWLSPPELPRAFAEPPSPLAGLPDPAAVIDRLRGTAFAYEVERVAKHALNGRYVLFGEPQDWGISPAWRHDIVSGKTTGTPYFRRVPYLDRAIAGDHKVIWELNRQQYLVAMAQAWRFTGRREFLDRIEALLSSWYAANPPWSGINWCSALEVAFRAWSWIWVWHLAGNDLSGPTRRELLRALFRHGHYLEHNLSFYFSPNTHLLGEAVVLGALGRLFPEFPRAARWRDLGTSVTRQQLRSQVHGDGSYFEQSTYYHVYALDMFLAHYLISGETIPDKVARMAEFLHALLGPQREIPFLGDDDGGRFFHPFGAGSQYGRATLATCSVLFHRPQWAGTAADLHPQAAWWIGESALENPRCGAPPAAAFFPDTGLWIVTRGPLHLVADAGPFGRGSGGHSHSDTLSLVLRIAAEELLIDSGTYSYLGDPTARERFRSSAAHNTIRAGGFEQATSAGPFRWTDKPTVRIREQTEHVLEAECVARAFTHRRRFELRPDCLIVTDFIEGPPPFEQFWQFGVNAERIEPGKYRLGSSAEFVIPAGAEARLAATWRSKMYGQKEAASELRVTLSGPGPHITRIYFTPN